MRGHDKNQNSLTLQKVNENWHINDATLPGIGKLPMQKCGMIPGPSWFSSEDQEKEVAS